KGLPVAFELVVVLLAAEEVPDVFDGDVEGAGEERVWELGAAVREALAFPVGGVEEDLLAGGFDLGVGGGNSQGAEKQGWDEAVHECSPSAKTKICGTSSKMQVLRLAPLAQDDKLQESMEFREERRAFTWGANLPNYKV